MPAAQRQSFECTTPTGFSCSVIAEHVAARVQLLREEFSTLKMGQLRKRAVAEGIEESVVDSMLDGADPLADLAEALATHVAYRPRHKVGKLSKEGSGYVAVQQAQSIECSSWRASQSNLTARHGTCGSLVVSRKSVLRSASKTQRRYFELDDEFLCYYQNTKSSK